MKNSIVKLLIITVFIFRVTNAFVQNKNVCLLDLQAYFSQDMVVNNSDIQGDTFVGGDANLNYFEINGRIAVRNYLTANHGTIVGKSYAGSSDFSFVGKRRHKNVRSNKLNDLNDLFKKQMFDLSAELSTLETNTQSSYVNGRVEITAREKVNIVSLSALTLKEAYQLTLRGNEDSLLIINIDSSNQDKSQFFRMTLELDTIRPENIIYNFYNAKNLTLGMVGPLERTYGTGIQGTIIAPYADINFFMGVIDGGLYGRSLIHTRPTGQIDPLKVKSNLIRDIICH